ncbi:unnamed protein product [Arctogadus glacialis]
MPSNIVSIGMCLTHHEPRAQSVPSDQPVFYTARRVWALQRYRVMSDVAGLDPVPHGCISPSRPAGRGQPPVQSSTFHVDLGPQALNPHHPKRSPKITLKLRGLQGRTPSSPCPPGRWTSSRPASSSDRTHNVTEKVTQVACIVC